MLKFPIKTLPRFIDFVLIFIRPNFAEILLQWRKDVHVVIGIIISEVPGMYRLCTQFAFWSTEISVPKISPGTQQYLNSADIIGLCDGAGQPETPSFPGPNWTGPKNGLGSWNIFKNIFRSGRVGEFYFGSVRVGIFFTGVWNIFSWDFEDKLTFHSQTEEVEWLLSLISTLFDVITSLQGIFTCLL